MSWLGTLFLRPPEQVRLRSLLRERLVRAIDIAHQQDLLRIEHEENQHAIKKLNVLIAEADEIANESRGLTGHVVRGDNATITTP